MPITGYIMNPPVLQKCSLWTIQDFSALECLWLWRESFSKLCSVPCVFRAFSEATPPVPLEMPAYVHLSTVWHGACVPPWAACTGILLFDPHAHSVVPQTTGRKQWRSNDKPGSGVWTLGIIQDISTDPTSRTSQTFMRIEICCFEFWCPFLLCPSASL